MQRFLILILVLQGCGQVSNRIDALKLDCGEEVAADLHWVKVQTGTGKDLTGDAFEVLTWNAEGQLQAEAKSSQGCFAPRANQDYIVRAPTLGQGLRISSKRLREESSIRLTDITSSGVGVNCRQDFMRADSNLLESLQWQGHTDSDAFTVQWSILEPGATQSSAAGEDLLTSENHATARRTLPKDLPEGKYIIQLQVHNLLRDQASGKGSCAVTLDRQPPTQTLSWTANRDNTHAGFVSVVPGSELNIKTQDFTGTRTSVCMTRLPDPDDATAAAETESCEWQTVPGYIAAPSSGYWNIAYRSIDAAGNESTVESRNIYSFNQQTIELIKLLADSIPTQIRGEGDPLQAVYDALKVEKMHRSLKSAYERSLARDSAERALYSILHKPFPYRVQKLDAPVTAISVSPNEEYYAVFTTGKGFVYFYRADGTLLWQTQIGEPGTRATFTPDSKHFALAGQNGLVKVWTAANGQELFSANRKTKPWVFKYNKDGSALGFAGFDGALAIWDMKTDHRTLLDTKFSVQLNDFSWNEQEELTVAAGSDLHFFDAQYQKKEPAQFTVDAMVNAVANLPGGYRFIISRSAAQMGIQVPSQSTTRVSLLTPDLKVLAAENLQGSLDRYRQSPDGKHFVISGNGLEGVGILQDWQAVIGQPEGGTFNGHLFVSKAHPKEISAAYWSPDSSIFTTTSFTNEMAVLNTEGNLVIQVLGPNTTVLGPTALILSRKLWISGGQSLRFWDLESSLFPSYYTQGLIAQHSMNSSKSKHLLVERNQLSYRIVVLDENLKPLQSWPWLAGPSYLKFPNRDFSPLFRSIRLLDNDEILTGDFYKNQIYRHALDGTLLPDGIRDVAKPNTFMTAFAPVKTENGMVVGYTDGSLTGFKDANTLADFSHQVHRATNLYFNEDINASSVLNIDPVSWDEIYSTGMDGRMMFSTSSGNPQMLFNYESTLNVYRHLADESVLLGGRTQDNLRYFRADGSQLRLLDNTPGVTTGDSLLGGEAFVTGYAQGTGIVKLWNKQGNVRTALDMIYRNRVATVSFSQDGKGVLAAGYNRLLYVPLDPNEIYQKICGRLREQIQAEGRDDVCSPDPLP